MVSVKKSGNWVDYKEADAFGVSPNGDLVLVKIVQGPQGPVGTNIGGIAKGSWQEVKCPPPEKSNIVIPSPAPPGGGGPGGQRIPFPGGGR